ncbi:hypothetical protein KKF05_04030 [Patescibacteria group bacterium]|nr:hypothetical protein [Patescibacteria group bacterium]MBU1029172.1 hypothetical protein [Patescibacteria group bacterium]
MKNLVGLLLVALMSLMSLLLTGCEDEMKTIVSSSDPAAVSQAVIGIFICWLVGLLLFSSKGFIGSMIYGARYTGIIILILAPFQFSAVGNINLGVTLLVVAVVCIFLPTIFDHTGLHKRSKPSPDEEE